MYVRLVFDVAAHLEPEILVVDEVLAVGDAEFQKKAIGKMQDISKGENGRTVLFVSHNMASIQKLCTKLIVIKNGEINYTGNVQNGIEYYLSENNELNKFNPTNRKGNADIMFTNLEILDKNKKLLKNITSGQSVTIRIKYTTNNNNAIGKNLILGLNFFDNKGIKKTKLNNYLVGVNLKVKKKQTFEISIDKFPFTSGIYTISLFSKVNNIISDWIDNSYTFEVVYGDYYGQKTLYKYENNLLLINYNWINKTKT